MQGEVRNEEQENKSIRNLIKSSSFIINEAYEKILSYQNKEFQPASTGYSYIDEALLGGIYPQNAIAIGARPGVGKSFVTQKIVENVMNPAINPQCMDYLLVNCEFEMNPMDLLLRRLSRDLKMPIKDILLNKPTELVEKKIMQVLKSERNQNIVYVPEPTSVKELEGVIEYVLSRNTHKRLVIFKIDHIALVAREGGDPKRTMDNTIAVINNAKLKYKNAFFLIISQFNRNIEERRAPKEQAPRMSDFYQSDELGQLCSLMIGLNNPRRLGYDEYMYFPANWFTNLDRFKVPGKKTAFRTDGLLFHHILKVRQVRIEELENIIYPEIMPGYGFLYGEGGVKYINKNQPIEEPPRYYDIVENGDTERDDMFD